MNSTRNFLVSTSLCLTIGGLTGLITSCYGLPFWLCVLPSAIAGGFIPHLVDKVFDA